MRFGVSYFGVRNPDHMQRDLDDMVRLGFDYVVLTFSENDHRFYPGSLAACTQLAHERGLQVWVNPWGVGGVFGGEAFTERGAWDYEAQQLRSDGRPLPLLCFTSEALRAYLRQWIETAAEVVRADAVFWDEPHFYISFGESERQGLWSCRCERCGVGFAAAYGYALPERETDDVWQWKQDAIARLIEEVTAEAAGRGLENIVCLLPDHDRLDQLPAKFDRFAANPHLQTLSTDPYPQLFRQPMESTRKLCEALMQACQRHGKNAQAWIQGFRIEAGQEDRLGDEMQLMAACGIPDIAIWSYLATAYMSSHACADSDRVWRVFTETMQALRSRG